LAHKNCITEHRSSLKHVESGVAMLTLLRWHYNWTVKVKGISQSHWEFVLLPACKICSAVNKISFEINHCANFPTHLCTKDLQKVSALFIPQL
jgi:hypothetical protein